VNDDPTSNDEELLDAADQAALLDNDAITRVEVAAEVAEAAEEAEADAVAAGDLEEAARIDDEADEVITELVGDAVVEAELAARIVDLESQPEGDSASDRVSPDVPDGSVEPAAEELVVVPDVEPAAETRAAAAPEPDVVEAEGRDPFRGPGDWYVVHTYAGYENKVKANLESRIHTMQMEDKIFRVHIPMEDVMEIKSGKKQIVQKKVFPGYLLVKMFYDNDSWYVVRNTPGVTGFVSAGTGSKPTPLSKREVEKILVVKKEEQKPQVRLGFDEGDVVRIISGPFADFNGTISEINADQAKLKVLVNIFDRETPVELSFDQVAKV
jgi:transcription termination/antitermination protein NusG